VIVVLLPAATVAAQVKPDSARADSSVFRVGEIMVQAARPVTTTGGASAVELRIDSLGLPPAPTLEQVLRLLPLVHVRINSRGEAELAVRGSESRQVALLVDGVPLTLGWDARTDVSVIPATAPRQISLVRGLSSVLYGPNVLGGIIEVGVGHGAATARRSAELASGVDHLGGWSASATATVPADVHTGSLLLRGGVGFRNSPGQPLAGGVGEPVPAADDALRLNTDARQLDGFLAIRRDWDGGPWASVSASGYHGRRGIAAELGVDEPRLWRYPSVYRLVGVASGGTGEGASPLGGRGDVEASVGLDLGRTEIDQYATRAYDAIIGEEDGDDRTLTLRLRGDQTIASAGELHAALTYADVNHDERLVPGGEASYRQRLWSAASEVLWRWDSPLPGVTTLRVSAGLALDGADTPESGDKPPLGSLSDIGWRLGMSAVLGGGGAIAHAGVSRRSRFPALRELYSGSLGRFEPNPSLEPERLLAMETGITTRLGKGELQLVGFYHQLSDAVVRTRTPDGKYQRVNQNEVESFGLEVLASAQAGPLALGADLTLQDINVHDPTATGPARPENQPRVFGTGRAAAALPVSLRGSFAARYTGAQYCIHPQTGEDAELAAGTRLDADLARTWQLPGGRSWLSRLEARVSVDNLADITTYDLCALPQPGRLVRMQFRLF
jgi:outer membrane receptor protein involved in Fe transport